MDHTEYALEAVMTTLSETFVWAGFDISSVCVPLSLCYYCLLRLKIFYLQVGFLEDTFKILSGEFFLRLKVYFHLLLEDAISFDGK